MISFQKNIERTTTPKLMNIFFLTAHAIFSLDFGFFKYNSFKAKLIVKLFSQLQCLFTCGSCCYFIYGNLEPRYSMWYAASVIRYIIYVTYLNTVKMENSFCSLQKNLMSVDYELGVTTKNNLTLQIIAFFSIQILYTVIMSGIYCNYYDLHCLPIAPQILCIVPYFGQDLPLIVNYFAMYSAYCRMNLLKECVKERNKKIVACHVIYKAMVLYVYRAKKSVDVMVLLSFLFNIPSIMIMIYYSLADIKQTDSSVTWGFNSSIQYSMVLQAMILMFSPAFSADWLSSEAEKIKLILHDRLLEERVEDYTGDIERFIRYIEARPLRFRVCKFIPLDSTLPLLVLNICTTYMIVIVQFTHLF